MYITPNNTAIVLESVVAVRQFDSDFSNLTLGIQQGYQVQVMMVGVGPQWTTVFLNYKSYSTSQESIDANLMSKKLRDDYFDELQTLVDQVQASKHGGIGS